MLFLAPPFWISVLSRSLESAVLVLSASFSLLCSQVGQPRVRLRIPASQAWNVIYPRPADSGAAFMNSRTGHCSGAGDVTSTHSAYNEGRTMGFRASEYVCLHFHLGSISTLNSLFGATEGNPLSTGGRNLQVSTCFSSPASETSFALHFGSWEIPSLFTPECFL